jgi:hypothetical protein
MPDRVRRGRRGALAALAALAASAAWTLAAPAAGSARGGGGDGRERVEASGRCGVTSSWRLRAETRDGLIRVDFEMRRSSGRSGPLRWRVVLLHERRIAGRALLVTRRGGSARLRRTIPDYPGADAIAVRAVSAAGEVCPAGALL